MHTQHAPAVAYPFQRSGRYGLVLLGVWLASSLVMCGAWLAAPHRNGNAALGAATLLLAGLAAYAGWRRSPAGQLLWDGQLWSLQSAATSQDTALSSPTVALDLQWAMLLHLQDQSKKSHWLWVERTNSPARWLDLRRAVYQSK